MNLLLLLFFVLLSAIEPLDVTGRLLLSAESGPWTTCNAPNGLIQMDVNCKLLLLCYQNTINKASKLGRRFRHGKVRTNGIEQFDECAKVMEGKEWHGVIIAKVKDGNFSFNSSLGTGGFLSTEQINTMATKTEINLTKNFEPLIREFQNALPFGVFLEDYGLINFAQDNLSSCEKSGTKLCKMKCLEGHFFNDWSKACKATVTGAEYDRLFPKNVDKYLFASWNETCGGLGNQMWRFASLYGIGKPFGRMPLSTVKQKCLKSHGEHVTEGDHELENLFPIYSSQIKYIEPEDVKNDTFFMKGFAPHCCAIEDPEKLAKRYAISSRKEKYLIVDGYYLQSYKFFVNRRTEIRQIFQFGHGICKTVEDYQKELFSNDQAHKFCVHVRLGDFERLGWATKKDFTELGIAFGFNFLMEKFSNVSIVLMGAEKKFLIDLEIDRQQIVNVYVPKAMPRGEDMAFGATFCDSLLITASASTFSWWMAYLMPDNATIFYNSNFKGTPFSRDNFLPEWVPIRLSNGTMALDY